METAEDLDISSAENGIIYNVSYKLASHLLRLPSRVLTRLRRLDGVWNTTEMGEYDPTKTTASNARFHARVREGGVASMPGPWGFVTSGYFIGLFFMAFILNRVQNIVVPSRHITAYDRRQAARRARRHQHDGAGADTSNNTWSSRLRKLVQLILPVDLSSTRSRFLFRIPTIYLLLKALCIWTMIIIQTAHLFKPTESSPSWTNALYQWSAHRSMEDVCWLSFLSVCAALFVGALTNGMEGLSSTSNHPFNLFGYAFVLYVYASPMTHVNKDKGVASRPDVHVLITMVFPLLQLTMIHILESHKRYARVRLVPTTITGVLSLVHFHSVNVWFPATYPLPNLVPNVVESFLIMVTLTSCLLNALTQLLTTGAVTRPLIGHTDTLIPKWDEDFSVALFRLGTASLEATNVAGWGNEVASVNSASIDLVTLSARDAENTIELARSGVVSMTSSTSAATNGKSKRGFANEIKHIRASSDNSELWADTLINVPWYRALGGFLAGLWKVLSALGRAAKAKARSIRGTEPTTISNPPNNNHAIDQYPSVDDHLMDDVYGKFLRGEDLSDDDQDFTPDYMNIDHATSSDDSDSEIDNEDEHDITVTSDTLSLYADLSQTASTASSSSATAPVLLAHLTNPSSSPLTRRRYSSLVTPGQSIPREIDSWTAFVLERRDAKRDVARNQEKDEALQESRRNCVICTAEPRQIICWPCRCLALCDDCRENLASRAAASKHMCPCCRRNVEGFSRIYIP